MLNSTASMLFCSASAVRRSASAWRAFVTMVCEDELADHAVAAFKAAEKLSEACLIFCSNSKDFAIDLTQPSFYRRCRSLDPIY